MSDKILIVDGYSILNRAYYGVPFLSNKEGFPTNGIYGFYGILLRLLDDRQPTHLAVAFDVHEPTFRHLRYEQYKGTRKPMPDDLKRQVPMLKQLLEDSGIPILTLPGYEADDLIGTAALKAQESGMEVLMLSGDRDLFQLVSPNCTLCIPRTRNKVTVTEYYREEEFTAEYGVTPEEFIAVKALMGDSSDNIPGVPHVGEKTALDLIRTYHGLDELYARLNDLKSARIRTLLAENEAQARLSYDLAKIERHAPLDFDPETARFSTLYTAKAYGDFFAMLLRLKREGAKIGCATLWGVTDRYTWLRFFRKQESYPLLFSGELKTKPAFDAVMDAAKAGEAAAARW